MQGCRKNIMGRRGTMAWISMFCSKIIIYENEIWLDKKMKGVFRYWTKISIISIHILMQRNQILLSLIKKDLRITTMIRFLLVFSQNWRKFEKPSKSTKKSSKINIFGHFSNFLQIWLKTSAKTDHRCDPWVLPFDTPGTPGGA